MDFRVAHFRFAYCIVMKILVTVHTDNLGATIDANPPVRNPPVTTLGKSDYRDLKVTGKPIVDKSAFIKLVLHEKSDVILFTRPRRFGKSINLSMLKHFLSFTENSTDLFGAGTIIALSPKFCHSFQNRWPVIYVDFTDRDSSTFQQALERIKIIMSRLYSQFDYLLRVLSPPEALQFNKILAGKGSESETAFAVLDLMGNIKDHCKSKVILLIDGYDSPLAQAFRYNYHEKMSYFMKNAVNKALKDNESVQKAVIMGTLPIAKEVILEGLQHKYMTYSFSNYDSYFGYFGFLEGEVKILVSAYKYSPKLTTEMSKRFGGYVGGQDVIYNPWSVVQCLEKNALVNDYWIATGVTAQAFNQVFETRGVVPIIQLKLLLDGVSLSFAFDFELSLSNAKCKLDSFWTLAVHNGFLVLDHSQSCSDAETGKISYGLKIPNEELMTAFQTLVRGYFQKRPIPKYDEFLESVKIQNFTRVRECLQSYMNVSGRFFRFDTLEGFEDFFTKLLVGLQKDYKSISKGKEGDRLAFKLMGSEKLDSLVFWVNYKNKNETKESLYRHIMIKICHFVRGKKIPEKIKVSSCHGSYFMTIDVQKTSIDDTCA